MTDASPDGLPASMIGNLSELAAMPGMPSEPTIKKLIDENPETEDSPGFPIITRGDRGVAWEIDLVAAATFIRDLQRKAEEKARARAAEVNQLGLDLLGADAASLRTNRVELTSADRRALMEEELVAIRLAEKRGELIRKDEAERALSTLAVAFTDRLSSLVARAAKRMDLPRELQVQLQRVIDGDRAWIADQLDRTHVASTDQRDPAVRDGAGPAAAGGVDHPTEESLDRLAMGD